jgi:hypothetical protein
VHLLELMYLYVCSVVWKLNISLYLSPFAAAEKFLFSYIVHGSITWLMAHAFMTGCRGVAPGPCCSRILGGRVTDVLC